MKGILLILLLIAPTQAANVSENASAEFVGGQSRKVKKTVRKAVKKPTSDRSDTAKPHVRVPSVTDSEIRRALRMAAEGQKEAASALLFQLSRSPKYQAYR